MAEADNMHKLEQRIDLLDTKLDNKLDELTRMVLKIEGSMMPRADVYSEDSKRVLVETYTANHQAVIDRITRLESGPQRFLSWAGAALGCLSVGLVALGIFSTILIAYFTHH